MKAPPKPKRKTTKASGAKTAKPTPSPTAEHQAKPAAMPPAPRELFPAEPSAPKRAQFNFTLPPELRAQLEACGADEEFHGGAAASPQLVARKAIGVYLSAWRADRAERTKS